MSNEQVLLMIRPLVMILNVQVNVEARCALMTRTPISERVTTGIFSGINKVVATCNSNNTSACKIIRLIFFFKLI